MEAKCYRAMRRDGQRHGPRRIAKHPEQSGLLPLPTRKRNVVRIGAGKRFTRLCLRGFAKHESYIYFI